MFKEESAISNEHGIACTSATSSGTENAMSGVSKAIAESANGGGINFLRRLRSNSGHEMLALQRPINHDEVDSDGCDELDGFTTIRLSDDENESPDVVQCAICDAPKTDIRTFYQLTPCHHDVCCSCLYRSLRIDLLESRIKIKCPKCGCQQPQYRIIKILSDFPTLMEKYQLLTLRRYLCSQSDLRWCPKKNCGYGVIAYNCGECPKLTCERPGCNTEFCYHCRRIWHADERCPAKLRSAVISELADDSSLEFSSSASVNVPIISDLRDCPKCHRPIGKAETACNHVSCDNCNTEFCWLCLQEVSISHFITPSGCTYWGKRQWSRRKTLAYCIGMVMLAPVLLILAAVLAIPAAMVGCPIWAYGYYKDREPICRFFVVMSAFVVSPVIGIVAVMLGIPTLLLYFCYTIPVTWFRGRHSSAIPRPHNLYREPSTKCADQSRHDFWPADDEERLFEDCQSDTEERLNQTASGEITTDLASDDDDSKMVAI